MRSSNDPFLTTLLKLYLIFNKYYERSQRKKNVIKLKNYIKHYIHM